MLLPREVPVSLIDADGTAHADDTYDRPDDDALLEAYRALVVGRRINEQCYALVRQGRLAVYPSSHGQEACQVAASLVLDDQDWLFPTYRDSVSVIARGVSPAETLVLLRGDWHSGYDPQKYRVAPQSTPLATQLLHAAGLAHAAKLRGEPTVVMALCGDGATSEGDFHEALNFAAVYRVPVVFFVQNNEFAISVPLSRQTAAPSLAHKAIGYGMPGQRVDGNDVAAVLSVLREAVDRARAGEGPSLVEAHTYRMQAHTNADDDTRYRERDEVAAWVARDPLSRTRTYLQGAGVLDETIEQDIRDASEEAAAALRDAMNTEVVPDPEDLFRYVFSERPPRLERQWQQLRDELDRADQLDRTDGSGHADRTEGSHR
ncbi:pyruvate dehydrogenase (acetyl-transferring) E1 component subunit alpha [Agromyces aerolatus]|uniref:pyruvate dehydrogenase (acetyl-transferring) E1 component subunit alpha n=1 Tax=Agromyces sp. LY-1074 TaxID=3074080 RepID=UPI00285A5848|nr:MULTISPECIES: pyruvate dehydrogenase (acetyl-transferring) E1 component subunit alpha [unclassified Agromyces]MDR5699454.1 pyruvate dehydrogenase (acetyl-transferring) E1 component subunit alpha [Agromyces sp. LY-1074]MDR5705750.1 pyruvate dehydrogenase (acetyl-transferring) E1 component subunit alpha [Agromyces sp. LY-1358]